MSLTALLIIDVQNDFLPPSGSLGVTNGQEILPIVRRLLEDEWLKGGWDLVVASQDWHPTSHISFSSSHAGSKPYTTIPLPRHVLGSHHPIPSSSTPRTPRTTTTTTSSSSPTPGTSQTNSNGQQEPKGGDDGQVDFALWPDHCIQYTNGAELESDLKDGLRGWFGAGKFALVRKGFQSHFEAFSAFDGRVLEPSSFEIPTALGIPSSSSTPIAPRSSHSTPSTSKPSPSNPTPDPPHPSSVQTELELETSGKDLATYLLHLGVGRVCVVGLATDYCVAQTSLSASENFQVYLFEPAVRGVSRQSSEDAVRECKAEGVELVRTEEEMRGLFLRS